jgi:signal transduction histidine kinase
MAVAVGTFFTAEEVFMDLAQGHGELANRDIVSGIQFWLIWIALTPAMAMAVRRWPLNTPRIAPALLAHAGMALVLGVIHNLVGFAVASLVALARDGGTFARAFDRPVLSQGFVWGLFTGAVFYTVVVMLFTALAFRAELAQVKLDTLTSQLRPHFLFNTLNAISVFAGEDAAKARQMILRLSTLLRRSLDQEAHEVPLEEELTFANEYLDIQRGRFGDRLAVVVDVSPDTLRANIPVFLLQPLLENAIEHGMTDDRPITVTVRARRAGDMLHLSVNDDGAGFDEDASRRHSIGNANARARLEQLYGARARIEWTSANGRSATPGTQVDIRIPYREPLI